MNASSFSSTGKSPIQTSLWIRMKYCEIVLLFLPSVPIERADCRHRRRQHVQSAPLGKNIKTASKISILCNRRGGLYMGYASNRLFFYLLIKEFIYLSLGIDVWMLGCLAFVAATILVYTVIAFQLHYTKRKRKLATYRKADMIAGVTYFSGFLLFIFVYFQVYVKWKA